MLERLLSGPRFFAVIKMPLTEKSANGTLSTANSKATAARR